MAILTITAANVVLGSNAVVEHGTFGATITQGQAVYKEAATGLFKLADDNSATAEVRLAYGIALNSGSTGQPGTVQKRGDITIGATMTPNIAYYLSGTPGGIAPVGDLTVGDYPCLIGMAKSATVLTINIQPAGGSL
jgi:hypothetical protein